MVVCMAIGIMFGCVWAGIASKGQMRYGFVTLGAWGIVISLSLLAALGATEGIVAGAKQKPVDVAVVVEANLLAESATKTAATSSPAAEGESFVSVLVPKSGF